MIMLQLLLKLQTLFWEQQIKLFQNSLLGDGTGFVAKIPKGTDILINTKVSAFANFKNYSLSKLANIISENTPTTMILNITEDLVVIANFDYIEYDITYIIQDNNVELYPNSYNIDSELSSEFKRSLMENTPSQ